MTQERYFSFLFSYLCDLFIPAPASNWMPLGSNCPSGGKNCEGFSEMLDGDGMISHDQNFKNVFLDFPKEALEWILPNIPAKMGEIRNVK